MDAYEYYLQGKVSLEKGEYESAIELLNISNSLDPHFKAYEKLYQCYINLNDLDRAFEAVSLSYKLNNRNDKTAMEYAQMLINYKKDNALARKILESILQRNPTYKKAGILLEAMMDISSHYIR